MIKKMRREWEQIQGDPAQMDEKLKHELKAIDEMEKGVTP